MYIFLFAFSYTHINLPYFHKLAYIYIFCVFKIDFVHVHIYVCISIYNCVYVYLCLHIYMYDLHTYLYKQIE